MKATLAGLLLLVAGTAGAQTFPATADWVALPCRDAPMTDPVADVPTALAERDLVGDAGAPAGFRAADANFLYLRIRVEEDPAPGGVWQPFAWGVEIDTDDVRTTYEVLITVSSTDAVSLYENTTTTMANSPADPADLPAVATYPAATHARAVAVGSGFGGDGDFFVNLAVRWSDLVPLGVERATPVTVWAGSSSLATSLDGDLACHSGANPTLSESAPDRTALDPEVDSDGDGFTDREEIEAGTDPNDPNSMPPTGPTVFEGGPGACAAGGHGGGWPALLALALALALVRARRRTE